MQRRGSRRKVLSDNFTINLFSSVVVIGSNRANGLIV